MLRHEFYFCVGYLVPCAGRCLHAGTAWAISNAWHKIMAVQHIITKYDESLGGQNSHGLIKKCQSAIQHASVVIIWNDTDAL